MTPELEQEISDLTEEREPIQVLLEELPDMLAEALSNLPKSVVHVAAPVVNIPKPEAPEAPFVHVEAPKIEAPVINLKVDMPPRLDTWIFTLKRGKGGVIDSIEAQGSATQQTE